jgi:hypothetical protein
VVIQGDFTQTDEGAISVAVASGNPVAINYIDVGGTATLDGSFFVSSPNGGPNVPAGQVFIGMNYGSLGLAPIPLPLQIPSSFDTYTSVILNREVVPNYGPKRFSFIALGIAAGPNNADTTIVSNVATVPLGQSVTFTATVNGLNGTPTGSLAFWTNGSLLGDSTLNGSGVATYSTSTLPAGSDNITAVYSGNGTYPSSISNNFVETVLAVVPPSIETGLSPNTGTTAGGTAVVLTGNYFSLATSVMFGTVSAQQFVVNSPDQITAIAPAEAAGTFNVVVTTPDGTAPVSAAVQFTYSAASVPAISSVSQTGGSTGGGTVVTVSGSGFQGATAVDFGSVPAVDFKVLSNGTIVATAPAEAAGTVDISVTSLSGTSSPTSSDHFLYTNASTPTVTSLDVNTGPSTGGTVVTVFGSGFTGATSVSFGSVLADFQVNSDGSITAYAPPQVAGTVDITVTSFSGTSAASSADQFTFTNAALPVITSLSVSSGSTAGGTLVTLTGSGFTNAYAVNIGGTSVASIAVNSDSQLSFVTPPNAAGIWDVTVSSFAGTSIPTASSQFTYTLASVPTVTSLGTTGGTTVGGTSVTLTGTNFSSASAVMFGTVPAASFVITSPTSIIAVSPSQVAGTVYVTVTTGGGTSASSSSNQFTFTAGSAPTVTSLATTGGSTGGGTAVTISGSGFLSATAVNFGSVAATFTILSDGLISAVSPSQGAGTANVTVTSPSGTSSTSSADQFLYTAASAPSISSVSANSGPTTGGSWITVLGSYFSGATSETIGGVASDFVVNSDNLLPAITPPLPAGTVQYGTIL